MADSLKIGWTAAQALERRRAYGQILGLYLLVLAILALAALVTPSGLSHLVGLPGPYPTGWVRLCGGLLLAVVVFWFIGLRDPAHHRWPNLVGIAASLLLALLTAVQGGGFLVFALVFLLFAILLGWAYFAYFRAELMSRP